MWRDVTLSDPYGMVTHSLFLKTGLESFNIILLFVILPLLHITYPHSSSLLFTFSTLPPHHSYYLPFLPFTLIVYSHFFALIFTLLISFIFSPLLHSPPCIYLFCRLLFSQSHLFTYLHSDLAQHPLCYRTQWSDGRTSCSLLVCWTTGKSSCGVQSPGVCVCVCVSCVCLCVVRGADVSVCLGVCVRVRIFATITLFEWINWFLVEWGVVWWIGLYCIVLNCTASIPVSKILIL